MHLLIYANCTYILSTNEDLLRVLEEEVKVGCAETGSMLSKWFWYGGQLSERTEFARANLMIDKDEMLKLVHITLNCILFQWQSQNVIHMLDLRFY